MVSNAKEVANYFINKAKKSGSFLTPMQVQKLVYIAHGYNLAIADKPLISDEIQAWEFGPVIPSLFYDLKQYSSSSVVDYIRDYQTSKIIKGDFTNDQKGTMDGVWDEYGHLEAFQLSWLTHRPDTPWDKTWNQQGGSVSRNTIIPNSLIKKHYSEFAL